MVLPLLKYQDMKPPTDPTLESETASLTSPNPEPSPAHAGAGGTTQEYGFQPQTALDILFYAMETFRLHGHSQWFVKIQTHLCRGVQKGIMTQCRILPALSLPPHQRRPVAAEGSCPWPPLPKAPFYSEETQRQ